MTSDKSAWCISSLSMLNVIRKIKKETSGELASEFSKAKIYYEDR